MIIGETIYLDYQASTPIDPRVMTILTASFADDFANPHAADHVLGWSSHARYEAAAAQVAAGIGADPDEIIFTSGATEANNLALCGLAEHAPAHRRRILISAIEHKCVLAAAAALGRRGFDVEKIRVNEQGVVDLDDLARRLANDVLLVSVMAVNNEVGAVQPLAEIVKLASNVGARVHSDGVQALAAFNVDLKEVGLDLMSLSAHKIYGPKGVGALFVRRELQALLAPLIHGGGQQNGLRAGTVPVPLCVAFGAAVSLMVEEAIGGERERLRQLRERLSSGLQNLDRSIRVNGPTGNNIHPGNLNICFTGRDARDLLSSLQPWVAASIGSACTSGIPEPSHVLRAIGMPVQDIEASIRFGLGRFSSDLQVNKAISHFEKIIKS